MTSCTGEQGIRRVRIILSVQAQTLKQQGWQHSVSFQSYGSILHCGYFCRWKLPQGPHWTNGALCWPGRRYLLHFVIWYMYWHVLIILNLCLFARYSWNQTVECHWTRKFRNRLQSILEGDNYGSKSDPHACYHSWESSKRDWYVQVCIYPVWLDSYSADKPWAAHSQALILRCCYLLKLLVVARQLIHNSALSTQASQHMTHAYTHTLMKAAITFLDVKSD